MGRIGESNTTIHDRGFNDASHIRPEKGIEVLKRLYYDTAQQGASLLKAVQELAPPSHILFGTEWPWQSDIQVALLMKALKQYDGFDQPALASVERQHALELFPRANN